MKERYEFDKMEGCEWIRDTEELNQPLYYDLETVSKILNKQDKIIKQLELHAELLEKYGIETTEELDGVLKPLIDNGELENWKSATFWKMQTERLKKELVELKQKVIVPKFVVGQEIWDKYLMAWKIKRVATHQFDRGDGNTTIIEIYRLGHDGNDDYNCCILPCDDDVFFATREEAEQKLAEIGGKDEQS